MTDGFIRVAAAIPRVKVADVAFNTQEIESMMVCAEGQGVEVLCFPELCLTSYSCQDLFFQQLLLEEAENALFKILELSRNLGLVAIVGVPYSYQGMLFNCAAVVQGGKLLGLIPKTFIPNHQEFYEKRWFSSSTMLSGEHIVRFCGQYVPIGRHQLFRLNDVTFGIEICEDLWAPTPPSSHLAIKGAEIIFNLSASNDLIGKYQYVRDLVIGQSARCHCAYVYTSCGYGESTQDIVFGGKSFIAENGWILAEGTRFSFRQELTVAEIDVERLRAERRRNTFFAKSYEMLASNDRCNIVDIESAGFSESSFALTRKINPLPFVPREEDLDFRCQEILSIQSQGLATRIAHTKAQSVVIGVSGGLDSTLALMVCTHAFDCLGLNRKGIVGVTMPGFGTTERTYNNSIRLMNALGITIREINISDAVMLHFRDIGHDPQKHDVVYENAQARERTQILMDISHQVGGFVVGTGDLSELALGWATYNGDHMSMYAVNSSVPKTLVKHLVRWVAVNVADEESRKTILDIVDTPISPELLPADSEGNIKQITEDLVGPYELHDFFLYYVLRYGFRPKKIFRMALRAFDGKGETQTYDEATIAKWLEVFFRRFFAQQFKRSCLPDGPKVGSCSISPRGDWRMPPDAVSEEWIKECRSLLQQTLSSEEPSNTKA